MSTEKRSFPQGRPSALDGRPRTVNRQDDGQLRKCTEALNIGFKDKLSGIISKIKSCGLQDPVRQQYTTQTNPSKAAMASLGPDSTLSVIPALSVSAPKTRLPDAASPRQDPGTYQPYPDYTGSAATSLKPMGDCRVLLDQMYALQHCNGLLLLYLIGRSVRC